MSFDCLCGIFDIARHKEKFLRMKLNSHYELRQNDEQQSQIEMKSKSEKKKKKKKKKVSHLNNVLNQSLGKKKLQMQENLQFNWTEYLTSNLPQEGNHLLGTILKYNKQKQWQFQRVEKMTDPICYENITHFRQNISKDFPVWNQHRCVEAYDKGDIVGISVNIKQNWCRFYKNGVMQYHVDELPLNDMHKGLWLFLAADCNSSFVIDRKV